MSSVRDVGTDVHTGFAVALLRAIAADAVENAVVSPWSVSSALAVLAPGVEERACHEIEQALAVGTGTDDVLAELAAGAAQVARHPVPGDGSVLAVANTLWVDDNRTPVSHFLQQLQRWPSAALRFAPMEADPNGVRVAINADVARTTRGLIDEILPEGSITSDDRAVIVNALYLLAGWIDRFDAARTSDEPFHAPSGQRDVPTMRAGGRPPMPTTPGSTWPCR